MDQVRMQIDFPIIPEEIAVLKEGIGDNSVTSKRTPRITPILVWETTLKELSIRRILQMEAICLTGKCGSRTSRA